MAAFILAVAPAGRCQTPAREYMLVAPFASAQPGADPGICAQLTYDVTETVREQGGDMLPDYLMGSIRPAVGKPSAFPAIKLRELAQAGVESLLFGELTRTQSSARLMLRYFSIGQNRVLEEKIIPFTPEELNDPTRLRAAVRRAFVRNAPVAGNTGPVLVSNTESGNTPTNRRPIVERPEPPVETAEKTPGRGFLRRKATVPDDEESLFRKIMNKPSKKLVSEYLGRFPNGKYKDTIEEKLWGECLASESDVDFKLYLRYFPAGRWANEVREKRAAVQAREVATGDNFPRPTWQQAEEEAEKRPATTEQPEPGANQPTQPTQRRTGSAPGPVTTIPARVPAAKSPVYELKVQILGPAAAFIEVDDKRLPARTNKVFDDIREATFHVKPGAYYIILYDKTGTRIRSFFHKVEKNDIFRVSLK